MESNLRILVYKRRLKKGCEREYEAAHHAIPGKVVKIYRDCGISDIRLYRTGPDLIMIVFMETDLDTDAVAARAMKYPEMIEWVNRMEDMFEGNGEWAELKQIFGFPPA